MSFLYQFVILIGISIGVITDNNQNLPFNNAPNLNVVPPVVGQISTQQNLNQPQNLSPPESLNPPENLSPPQNLHQSESLNQVVGNSQPVNNSPGITDANAGDNNADQDESIIDETRSIEQLIVDYGYSFTTYCVTTKDGYILTIYRIKNPCLPNEPLDPIILGHPTYQDGSIFIDGSPIHNPIDCTTGIADGPLNINIGFLLADLGYDVFLPSFRGFRNSRNHTKYNSEKDTEYWDFSFDEMGKFDAPAIVDFVLSLSTYSEVIWIGHSLGVTVPLVLLATDSSYEAKIRLVIGLAPTVFMGHTMSPSLRYWSDSGLGKEKKTEIGPREDKKTPARIKSIVDHRGSKEWIKKWSRSYFSAYGYDPAQTNSTRLSVFYAQITRTSLSTHVHLSQLASSSYFRAFDGGKKRNQRVYGKSKPPLYKISHISNVTFEFIASPNDKVAKVKDVKKLAQTMKASAKLRIVKYKKMNHFGFLWSLNRGKIVNDLIVDLLKEHTAS